MIEVKGLNNNEFLINVNLIEMIEFIPETKVSLTTGKYYLIQESKQEIIDKIVAYNRKIYREIIVK